MLETTEVPCKACGEPFALVLDRSGGRQQEFTEDCAVCCRPQWIQVEWDRNGNLSVTSRLEQY